jgi:hypothetical protein
MLHACVQRFDVTENLEKFGISGCNRTGPKAPFRWQNFWGEISAALLLLFGKIYLIID